MKEKPIVKTGRRAKALTKRIITNASIGPGWQLVECVGSKGGESTGIVDILAIRKDRSPPSKAHLKRGDLFEIVLIQVKGGTSRWHSLDEIKRMRVVAKHYRAKSVVLAVWKEGKRPVLYRLKKSIKQDSVARDMWREVADWQEACS